MINHSVDIEGTLVTPDLVRVRRHNDICAIRINNISPDISDDLLKLLFESKSASGGGEIEDMFIDRDNMTAVITYLHLSGLFLVLHKLICINIYTHILYYERHWRPLSNKSHIVF